MDLLGVRSLPFLTRSSFSLEFKQLLFWSALAGLVEGQFGSVVVAKSFGGSPLLIAVATATPIGAFMSSLIWGSLCVGRPKIRLLTFFCAATALCSGVVGAIPGTPAGAYWFIAQTAAAQILTAGVLTVRSAVWRHNYPVAVRGRITSRLQRIRFVISVATTMIAAAVCDRDASFYRYVYPLAAALGLISAWIASRMRIRGEMSELANHNRAAVGMERGETLVEPLSLTALISPGRLFRRMHRVLRDDPRFRTYCIAQSMLGTANFMAVPVVAEVVTRRLDLGYAWGFWISTALIVALPQLAVLGTLGRWGVLFDRLGLLRFRVLNVSCMAASLAVGAVATMAVVYPSFIGPHHLVVAIGLFAVRGLLVGAGRGGGALAWHLGHLHFAKAEQAEVYMGIHVFLTGLRGLVAPFIGIFLWQHLGWSVWLVAFFVALVGLVIFWAMANKESRMATRGDR